MKIIDAFMVNSEIDLVLARIKYLYNSVDHFVLLESDRTHSNKPKPLHFRDNFHLFDEVKDKISLNNIAFGDRFHDGDNWGREQFQRNSLLEYLQSFDDEDVFIISDADEIPDTRSIQKVAESANQNGACKIHQEMFYYNLTNKLVSYPIWGASFAIKKSFANSRPFTFSDMRLGSDECHIKGSEYSGWHLTYFMTPEKIKEKIQSFAHVEFDNEKFTDVKLIEERVKHKIDPYVREDHEFMTINPDEHFPEEFLKYFGAWRQ